MNRKQLLVLAAAAAGIEGHWADAYQTFHLDAPLRKPGEPRSPSLDDRLWWDPLIDDGDALRLAVTLGLWIDVNRREGYTRVGDSNGDLATVRHDKEGPDDATRSATVQAAVRHAREAAMRKDKAK